MRSLLALLLTCCGPKPVPVAYPLAVPDTLANENVHLLYQPGAESIGSFSASEPGPAADERGLGRTACSEFLAVTPSEPSVPPRGLVNAGPEAAVRAGRASADGAVTVWGDVVPQAGRKAAIADPNGLSACCQAHPDGCSGWYVSETWSGTGQMHHPTVAEGGMAWATGATLHESPWAFALSSNPYVSPGCGPWQLELPVASGGVYALGVSNATFSERTATTDAVARMRESMIVQLRQRGLSDGLVEQLREERWCVETFPGAGGDQFIAQVLAYVPVVP